MKYPLTPAGLLRIIQLLALCALAGGAAARTTPPKTTPTSTSKPAQAALPANAKRLTHGRFKDFIVYTPAATPTSFVLFLSGDEGWNGTSQAMALELVKQGAMVAGLDLPQFEASLDADTAQCVFPDGDLENLSHFVQAYAHNPSYLAPMLVGVSSGATFAYAMLAQSPKDTFASALTVNFCPHFNWEKPLCKGSGVEYERSAVVGSGAKLKPVPQLGNPWVTLQNATDKSCPAAEAVEFASKITGAAAATLPNAGLAPFNAAFGKLAAANLTAHVEPAPAALGDLPVVEVAAKAGVPPKDTVAILMSGDGGWAGLDQEIAAALSVQGIPVVGLDSLRYYWTARTPDSLAADTDKMIRYYLSRFNKQHVLLIGYSQGADVLPFAINRLPGATRQSVSLVAILGMSEHALFEFHVASWVSDDNSGPETLPEVNRITGTPVLCIYGEDENDSLCPKLDAKKFIVVKMKGGHHFDGNYTGLAQEIIKYGLQQPSSRSNP
jgi:type IV secretory pathway VirJ component